MKRIITNKEYEDAYNDSRLRGIINSASIPYRKVLDHDDIESAQNIALWKALKNFNVNDPSGANFKTYLFTSVKRTLQKECKKKHNRCKNVTCGIPYDVMDESEVNDVHLSLNASDYNLYKLRYIDRKTYHEIKAETGDSITIIIKKLEKIKNRLSK